MRRNREFWPENHERLRWDTRPLVAFIIGVGCLAAAGAASAAETTAGPVPLRHFPVGQVFAMLFLMLGPFKIIGPFFKVTRGADARLTRQIAVWATIFSALALLIAGFLGENILSSYGIPLPVLALSGGVILFLVALKNVLEQFEAPEPHTDDVGVPPAAAMKVALAPLAFPTIVTPYGIAAVVVLVAFSQSLESRLTIGAVVVAIMVLNLIVMLVARRLQTVLAFVLPIFGAVLGVVQVALGLQIINNALRMLEVL
jgi:small neutral amino acid transporter SnatA (MarC family)